MGTIVMRPIKAGITSKQMKNAPRNAIFVWPNILLDYPQKLARSLNRQDLQVVSVQWLCNRKFKDREFPCIILDHTCRLSKTDWSHYWDAIQQCRQKRRLQRSIDQLDDTVTA